MLNCKQVSELVSRSMDRKLPLWRRLGVWMHLGMCRFCLGFRRQLFVLQEAARRNAERIAAGTDPSGPVLSSEARQRIQRLLESGKG